ncbi:hypothetical protein BD626DRAFT_488898 [Schizophyllum amplum]|uniref:ZZ-type domain-containing protein n=1 Tax=Schizophyllum amplum TaxID=97359 RepID=A0A550CL27_9AGAR|nr:hypothetical protein BD626DRAFT_488898 [Auriculariopsis ampla]
MQGRPDKPLVVKCAFDGWHKRISFNSARNCTYHVLRRKVEQCFSLVASSYTISYKDDDGEITDITTETDLTEAIQYFQAGTDDAALSSAASILSGRSFGNRRITLRVTINVDYDGPSLSDTSSLASLDEYKGRSGSQLSLSIGSLSGSSKVPEDDNVTVSSRDTRPRLQPRKSSDSPSEVRTAHAYNPFGEELDAATEYAATTSADSRYASAQMRFPENPSAVFERLRAASESDDASSVFRGSSWLRDQNERVIRAKLGALPAPSDTDTFSLNDQDSPEGDLDLQMDEHGKYYYSYRSAGSSSQHESQQLESEDTDGDRQTDDGPHVDGPRIRPASRHLNWLASQQVLPTEPQAGPSSLPRVNGVPQDIPPELLQFIPLSPPAPDRITACSECGLLLESIRYVCAVCGERPPANSNAPSRAFLDAHNGSPFADSSEFSYPPSIHRRLGPSSSSRTLIGTADAPTPSRAPVASSSSLHVPGSPGSLGVPNASQRRGYELCADCIHSAGINHAIQAGLAPGSSPTFGRANPYHAANPAEAARLALQWRRSAPSQKGQLRHAYREQVWTHSGWEDVEQAQTSSKCSTCDATTRHKCYKCASCDSFNLCRACYSQVHDLHPSHAFIILPDPQTESGSLSDGRELSMLSPGDDETLIHPGVKCVHCMLDIVGARFHCAICDAVDICANCESAGLPGNLDSADGGHDSSHIMIKIPYPLDTTELQSASRRAIDLWRGRDAASVGIALPRSKPSSIVSGYARTVIGSSAPAVFDHHLTCDSCGRSIVGTRYQCGSCPSSPVGLNLCEECEKKSYAVHNPTHIFFVLPRPVQRPLESSMPIVPPNLYKSESGPPASLVSGGDPRAYLRHLVHPSAVCDRCVRPIQGEWFRCAYCAKDLCDACHDVDTHNDAHVFLVFKAAVDMQAFRRFSDLDNPKPIIPYPVYR